MENTEHSFPALQDAVAALLQRHGITPTEQRMQIAALLFEAKQHVSAEQIIARSQATGAAVSKATVYNTLGLFAAKGLIREMIVDPSRIFYDTNTTAHYHFFDVDAGVLTDIDADAISLAALPPAPAGSVMEGVDIILRIRKQRTATV